MTAKQIVETIRERIVNDEYKRVDVAKAANITPQCLRNYLQYQTAIPIDRLVMIMNYIGLEINIKESE